MMGEWLTGSALERMFKATQLPRDYGEALFLLGKVEAHRKVLSDERERLLELLVRLAGDLDNALDLMDHLGFVPASRPPSLEAARACLAAQEEVEG